MRCPGAPRRSGRAPATINKTFKTLLKQANLANPATQQIQWGRAGAPSAPRGPQSSAKAHVENPWENKGKRKFLEVPLCYARDGVRGEQIPATINQKSFKNVVKTSKSGKSRYAANPMRQNVPPCRKKVLFSIAC